MDWATHSHVLELSNLYFQEDEGSVTSGAILWESYKTVMRGHLKAHVAVKKRDRLHSGENGKGTVRQETGYVAALDIEQAMSLARLREESKRLVHQEPRTPQSVAEHSLSDSE
ncbi:hypothetical protein NDU88_004324 [Pleurodeles waltl]|uniref:Uncharacterized protein n=1 Tax=Pleurodeles waltl TaxID=8319 RepID=A0AAV7TR51_PLEWA|nr:hypothetical protein NDU88_004324 [Pleurodeles waltl]